MCTYIYCSGRSNKLHAVVGRWVKPCNNTYNVMCTYIYCSGSYTKLHAVVG